MYKPTIIALMIELIDYRGFTTNVRLIYIIHTEPWTMELIEGSNAQRTPTLNNPILHFYRQ
jgi:hypothetical protein